MTATLASYHQFWDELSARQQEELCVGAFELGDGPLAGSEERARANALTKWLAQQLRYRPETLRRRPARYRAKQLSARLRGALPESLWPAVFRSGAGWAFEDAAIAVALRVGLASGDEIYIADYLDRRSVEEWASAFLADADSNDGLSDRVLLARCLILASGSWSFLVPAIEELQARDSAFRSRDRVEPNDRAGTTSTVAANSLSVLTTPTTANERGLGPAFTTIDRVLIDQIVASAAEASGALNSDDLDDLLQTVVAFAVKVPRIHHHLGFADVLVADRTLDWSRAELNDERRGWYLVGALTACVRLGKTIEFSELVRSRAADFEALYDSNSPAGEHAANVLAPYLLDKGQSLEATNLISNHIGPFCRSAIRKVLVRSAARLRAGAVSEVSPIVEALFHAKEKLESIPGDGLALARMAKRLMAQVCQARGEFGPARTMLTELRHTADLGMASGVLADLALVDAGIASISDLRLPDGADARDQLREALAKGEELLRKGASGFRPAPRATLALAMLDYLVWANLPSDSALAKALASVRTALATTRATKEGAEYQNSGFVGQCQFMECVLLMNRLTVSDAREALSLWKTVPTSAGYLPSEDIGLLLPAAQAISDPMAATLVESLVTYGRRDTTRFLRDPVVLQHSPALLERSLASVRDESLTDREKWDRLIAVVPAAVRSGDSQKAAEAVELLHELALRGSCALLAQSWFSQESNYEAVWDTEDALWARAQIAHCQGDLSDCGNLLARLFWFENHRDPESAKEILDLMAEWRIPTEISNPCAAGLVTTQPDEPGSPDASVARLKVVFVGGNEVQERYDQVVERQIAGEYPNAQIEFFHTGWSPNWGRELPGILRAANAADAVVIMRFIRTMLGRELRAKLTKPWVACTGHGRDSVVGSIRRALAKALAQGAK